MSTSNSATFITHAPTPGVPIAAGGGPPGDGEGGGGGEGGGPPGLGLPAPVVPVVPIFALSPALINNNVIDYATPEGIKLYKQAVSPLPITYNGTGNSLHLFLTTVQERAAVSNWSDVLTIPDSYSMDNLPLRTFACMRPPMSDSLSAWHKTVPHFSSASQLPSRRMPRLE
jgi:hypothetical protein